MKVPHKINLGSGKDFREEYLNIDINSIWEPDIHHDISVYKAHEIESDRFGFIKLEDGYFEEILCNDVLEHIPDLVSAMTNCLNLLCVGGRMEIVVPYDLSHGAWQDPTHVRAFNERSWLYYTDWFWYLNWRTHRFELKSLQYGMEEGVMFCEEALRAPRCVSCMKVTLEKVELSKEEKIMAESYYSRNKK